MMMLPYRAEFLFVVLVLAVLGSAAVSTTKNIWRHPKFQLRLTLA